MEHFLNLQNDISFSCTSNDINNCIQSLENIFNNVASPFVKKVSVNNSNDVTNYSNQPWYNNECYEKQQIFYRCLNKFRACQSETNRVNMVKARSEYKILIRKCRTNFDKEKTNKLLNIRYKNARLYWKMLKESSDIKQCNIPLSNFAQYFKAVNNPEDRFFSPDEDILHFVERYEKNEFKVMFSELNTQISIEEIR